MTRHIELVDDAEIPNRDSHALGRRTRSELMHWVRAHTRSNLYDESGAKPAQIAIYSLSDPREIRDVRYVGQTRAPRARFLQHVSAARLWLPETLPWWIKSPQLRPLYAWIRTLYFAEQRFPLMIISKWTASLPDARAAERARILECLRQGHDLCNIEKATFDPHLFLL